ncbi:DUF6671 family protein [Undibacterium sp. Di24W]|uniref:DUF6671 family protein n=1 Tax=Undibacterium sp. Di24W TaxID=3413033 RepID=UPI003BF232F2
MAKPSRYYGNRVALLTQHGKEAVIAPVLEPGLSCSVELVTGFDTDQLGTFTRETARYGTQLEAARRKARKGMELTGASLGIASEGSFGPDPYTGMFPWNVELLVWIDDNEDIEVVGIAQGAANSGHILSKDWQAIADFAEQVGFPSHQLVLRPDGQNDTRIFKDIDDWIKLKNCFESSVAQSRNGSVFAEVDLRAFANPSRMKRIEQAASDLLQRLQSTCPTCDAPGFWVSERKPGLPCATCRLPTSSFLSEVWTCVRCEHQHSAVRTDRSTADPTHCAHCNP